ncbi:SGNH/GDSL hydrolase family protein [Cerasicoccus arenae]|uniref:Lipase n=1 Tax=Cerasicoccus arenae TaxID=424488 RepID=A0A8J3DEL5_9BACT|nr:SGNH/GDSL hydrolase family protein [Cerasicoccus arenae]MBK1857837.1 SGNH/GDSL hydrolase family protein [Cerasicoccus arenae]GHC11575.1 lipase [Cerasicoccus arenae]
MGIPFKTGQTILFQGDSITDASRNKEDGGCLGVGYVRIIASLLGARYPEADLKFINRGISGNRVPDLAARWDKDCLDLKPDWLSILIGVNDCWRAFDSNDPTSTEVFEEGYRGILDRAKDEVSQLILCEPFLLHTPEDRAAWRGDLDPKIHVVRKLAREYGAILVPFDGVFAAAACRQEMGYWAGDGVHPSPAGHGLMAKAWMQYVRV